MFINKFNQKGFALTEVLIAFGILIILAISAYPLYKHSRTEANISQIMNDIVILQKDMNTVFRGNYNNPTTMTESDYDIQQMGLAPVDLTYVVSNGNFAIPSGGYLETQGIVTPNGPIAPGNGYSISISQIPEIECNELTTRLASSFKAIGDRAGDGSIKGNGAYTTNINTTMLENICSKTANDLVAVYFQNS
jgi:type II secretory pathway pseudopilin PulG